MLFAVFFFVCATSQKPALVNQAYPSSCTNTSVYWDMVSLPIGQCFPSSCNCNAGNVSCTSSTCNTVFGTAFPNPPAGFTIGAIFYLPSGVSTQCNTIDTLEKVFIKNTQCQRLNGYSAIACCRNGSMTWVTWSSSDCTTGFRSSRIFAAGGCQPVPGGGFGQTSCPAGGPDECPMIVIPTTTSTTTPTTTPAAASNSCFHADTRITYKDSIYALADLRDFHECSIPHIVTTSGLRIETALHVLRVTPDHLIFSRDRLVPASTLRVNDMIDTIEGPTPVKTITIETDQTYFGLNCLESIVIS